MAQLLVRNIEDDVKERLKAQAQRYGMSLEELVRDILRAAAVDRSKERKLGSEIAARFRGIGFKEGEIQELRGYAIKPPDFGE
jgi:plasmid stability protein